MWQGYQLFHVRVGMAQVSRDGIAHCGVCVVKLTKH